MNSVSFTTTAQLLQHLHAALRESEPGTLHAYLLARDALLISVLWHTALRGDNAVRLRSGGLLCASVPLKIAHGQKGRPSIWAREHGFPQSAQHAEEAKAMQRVGAQL